MDDDDEFEGPEGMTMMSFVAEADPGFISNEGQWPSSVMRYHPLDAAVTVVGLAANISTSFSVFFADIRRDLCAARNKVSHESVVNDFDEQLMALPVLAADDDDQ